MHATPAAASKTTPVQPFSQAAGWEKWHAWNARCMQPLCEWFCAATGAAPGQQALDLACGTGLPSLALAERVQPGGSVLATDLSPEMIAAARRVATRAHARGLEHRVASAQDTGVPARSFDLATCAFGLMFCPEPAAAVGELRRALRPGGRFAVAVWDEMPSCPFFTVPFSALAQIAPPPPPAPGSRGMFGLAPASALEEVLRAGGMTDFTIESRTIVYEVRSVAEYMEMLGDMAAPIHAALTTLPADEVARLRALIAEGTRPFAAPDGTLRLPACALCASGRV